MFILFSSSLTVKGFNPFPDEQLNLLDIVPKPVCHFSSLSIFCLGCKTISQPASWLIALHPKQNIESELKWLKF
jgi:hypothetical protein